MINQILFVFLFCLLRENIAENCTQAYACYKRCYVQDRYSYSCGFLFWGRCTRYSRRATLCTDTCYSLCCEGYTGSNCTTPICTTPCKNGGTCVSPDVCTCAQGFAPPYCEDIDECSVLNGGCREICTNTVGSFKCSCHSGQSVQSDGSCPGKSRPDVFQNHNIKNKLLPKGCLSISIPAYPVSNVTFALLSTSNWYSSSDLQTRFTSGIVSMETSNLSVPFSIVGAEISQSTNTFSLSYKSKNLGSKINISNDAVISENCMKFEFNQTDLIDFIHAGSILKSLFRGILNVTPQWLKLHHYNGSIIDMQDIKTNLIHGDDINSISECTGAPVFGNRLYAVFSFRSRFSLSMYNNEIHFPDLFQTSKFCLIVDIYHDHGGTVFLMVPEESRDILQSLDFFRTLSDKKHFRIRPRGIGLSLAKGIYFDTLQSSLHLWNGDRMFEYSLSNATNIWIGGDLIYNPSIINIKGSVDMYATVPSMNKMPLALFYDEWSALIRTTGLLNIEFHMKVFGKNFTIRFPIADSEVKAIVSVGGRNQRSWCGDVSNPPGMFFAAKMTLNPFLEIPILKDFIFDLTAETYVLLTTNSGSTITPDMRIDIVDDVLAIRNVTQGLFDLVTQVGNSGTHILLESRQGILYKLQDIQNSLQEMLTAITDLNFRTISNVFTALWKEVIGCNRLIETFKDELSDIHNNTYQDIVTFLTSEQTNLKHRVYRAIQKFTDQMADRVRNLSGLGFKFRAELRIKKIKIFGVDFEMVYSSNALLQCSRFNDVKKLLKGQPAVRFLGILSKHVKLNPFIKADVGGGLGMSLAMRSRDVVVQLHAHVKLLGITITKDVFLYESKLQMYIEGNLWGVVFVHLDITSHLDENWPELSVHGSLSAKARKKRQIQTDTKYFEDSYLDGMRKIISNIVDDTTERLSEARNALRTTQNKLTNAQNWLEEKKEDVRNANTAFDRAVASLEDAKRKLEEAKGPFERAMEKLNAAQRKVDNLCKIRSCSKICMPGIKCNICWKKVWFVKVPYPCCHFTSCMLSVPDPVCALANTACQVVRNAAYIALETARAFVRLPMKALDLAKLAVSASQVVVDKSRVVLKVAEGALEVAKFELEIIKTSLEVAEEALKAVELVIGVAVKVVDSVIRFGLQNILDVRNCQFNIKLLVVDLSVFDVSCEVNAFKTGWRNVEITINFKNFLQSLWSAARATIDAILKSIGHLISGRRRRETTFISNSKMHILLRKIRAADHPLNASFVELNDTEYNVNDTMNLFTNYSNNYEERTITFDAKCKTVTRHVLFLKNTLETLNDIAVESKSSFDIAENVINDINEHSKATQEIKFSAENLGINVNYGKHYDLSEDKIYNTLNDFKTSMTRNTNINVTEFSKDLVNSEIQSMNEGQIANAWITALENITDLHFNSSDCVGFTDCVLFSMSTLYDIFSIDNHSNLTEIRYILTEIEDNILTIVQNSSYNINGIYNVTADIKYNIQRLTDLNIYCSKPPILVFGLKNVTTLYGGNATFFCQVDSDPSPEYWWYRDVDLIMGERESVLTITNTTTTQHAYRCVAGNVVANITSNYAFISMVQNDTGIDPCLVDNGGCEQMCRYQNQSVQCFCKPGYEILDDGITCKEINECHMADTDCIQQCDNTIGSYRCSCFDGYHFDQLTNMCVKDQDACEKHGLDCSNTSGCDSSDSKNPMCFCQDGYQLSGDGTECDDIDECSGDVCNQACVNTEGGYYCTCSIGFVLDESGTCKECDYPYWGKNCNQTCDCVAATRCDPVNGCICEEGWRGEKCGVDINECGESSDVCNDTMQECFNYNGYYSCVCKEGYTKNEDGECRDSKECSWKPSPCEHTCVDMEGSFVCNCLPGYTLGDDRRSCIDIKECSLNMHSCQQICIETKGSYRCDCRPGYTLSYDRKTCVAVYQKPVRPVQKDNTVTKKTTGASQSEVNYGGTMLILMMLITLRLQCLIDFI